MHAFLGVPVTIRGRTIGNLYLTEKDGGFGEVDQQLVELFAGHAAIAMENARLHDQVQRLAIVEERERIGRDLHDGVIQSIYAVGLSLEDVPDLMVEEPAEGERASRASYREPGPDDPRHPQLHLRPASPAARRRGARRGAGCARRRVPGQHDGRRGAAGGPGGRRVPLGPERTLEVLSVAREALSNIARHAKATRAEILVATAGDGEEMTLTIIDNGVGFDPDAPRGLGHLGLANMDARMAGIGGALAIESSRDRGTRIIVQIPRDSSVGETEDGPEA